MQQDQFILPKGITVRDPQGNRYLIEGLLGKGEFGAVYLVRERDYEHRRFALKEVINPDKGDRQQFAFEGELLKRLSHRALPRVYSVFENDRLKRVYLLMDFIDGPNLEMLREQQTDRRFTLPFALTLMAPIMEALSYLHGQNPSIVHRDVKPANIIVPIGRGEAMLADFGSAKEHVPGTGTTLLSRRSPGYAALEQYRGGTNPATDIYGLGATLYTLLTGQVPVDAPSRVVAIATKGVDPLQPVHTLNTTVSIPASEAIQRAMSIKNADRFEGIETFLQALTAPARLPQTTAVLSIAMPQRSSPDQEIAENDSGRMQSVEQPPPRGRWRSVSTVAAFLVIFFSIGSFFCYLLGFTILFFCCLGILLLSLALLLYDVSTRASRRRNAEFAESDELQ